jgi:hypothetical protein
MAAVVVVVMNRGWNPVWEMALFGLVSMVWSGHTMMVHKQDVPCFVWFGTRQWH